MFKSVCICLLFCIGSIILGQDQKQIIAFGSCCHQDKPQKIWPEIVKKKPDLFIFLGDNIYGDTLDMDLLQRKYQQLAQEKGFQDLKSVCPIIATWDDHDYGVNDAGASFPKKEESQQIFLDFFKEPQDSKRRNTPGIYTSYFYGEIQVILLDVRFFLSSLEKISDRKKQVDRHERNMGIYLQTKNEKMTMLGEVQWQWLEQELLKPAKIRIVATSTQFLTDYNGWEAWRNMPHEYERMISLLRKTKANGVVFISGDTHWAELSTTVPENLYPLYDLTSSGLTEIWKGLGPNKNRVYSFIGENFGSLEIEWEKDPQISLCIYDVKGKRRIIKKILLSELQQ